MSSTETQKDIDKLLAEANRVRNTDPLKSHAIIDQALSIAAEARDEELGIKCGISKALTLQVQSKFSEAIAELNSALLRSKRISSEMSESDACTGLGNVYYYLGDYDNALKYHLEGLRLREKFNDKRKIAFSINSVGVVYATMKNYRLAEEYFDRSLEMNSAENDDFGTKMAMNNLGVMANEQQMYDKAILLLEKALDGSEKLPNDTLTCELLINLGDACREKRLFGRSEKYFNEVLKILAGRKNFAEGKSLEGKARLELLKKDFNEAGDQCRKAIALYGELNRKDAMARTLKLMGDIAKAKGDLEESLECFSKYMELTEELHREETVKKTRNLTLAFEAENLKKESEISYLRNVELRQAYEQINQKNSELIDSIQYAQYFQEMIFSPYRKKFIASFPDSFIFSLAKDIVSGDFLWCREWDEKFLLVLSDCTGHGVPGALVSITGNDLLNAALREKIYDPSLLLKFMNERFCEMGSDEKSNKAGMDATVLLFDRKSNSLMYSAVNGGLLLLDANGAMTHYKGSAASVGLDPASSYQTERREIKKGDTVYLFTDGFHTQKGGPAGKKFLRNAFINLVKEWSGYTLAEQHKAFRQKFEEWKGAHDQQDDISVVGFRI
ncbi:MAG TPA: tetratricopeptide repeat protein [Bacteroidia bacterium]|jgi:serine phosphatase RsbU (regulator of sigma subunit)